MFIARWQIEARFGHKDRVIELLREWEDDIGSKVGLPERSKRVTGSIGASEATIELDLEVESLAELERIFNAMGAAAVARPLTGFEVNSLDLGFMVGIAMLTLPLMITGFKLQRREGALLVAVYFVWLILRWPA